MDSARSSSKPPNCMQCRYFYVTYEPRHPRGCRAYGFKCQGVPSAVVLSSSGAHCQMFCERPKKCTP
ncbi:MAG: hypothetical protein CSB34_04390 [Desulfobulbus propionicus]|nr:MAG: hypothetical protein CSB34_04390 [Desulfobulbus propionicus]